MGFVITDKFKKLDPVIGDFGLDQVSFRIWWWIGDHENDVKRRRVEVKPKPEVAAPIVCAPQIVVPPAAVMPTPVAILSPVKATQPSPVGETEAETLDRYAAEGVPATPDPAVDGAIRLTTLLYNYLHRPTWNGKRLGDAVASLQKLCTSASFDAVRGDRVWATLCWTFDDPEAGGHLSDGLTWAQVIAKQPNPVAFFAKHYPLNIEKNYLAWRHKQKTTGKVSTSGISDSEAAKPVRSAKEKWAIYQANEIKNNRACEGYTETDNATTEQDDAQDVEGGRPNPFYLPMYDEVAA